MNLPNQNKFPIGEVVSLNSGGPSMTIFAHAVDSSYSVVWFNEKDDLCKTVMPHDCLVSLGEDDENSGNVFPFAG